MLLNTSIYKNHKKALVLGTGGGNDIVSALIVALNLQNNGLEIGLAGVNSPAAVHTYDGQIEQPINQIGKDTKRYINAKIPIEISYVDAALPDILDKHTIDIKNVYDFSTRYGTNTLSIALQDLIEKEKYDLLVAVDVGGDILARGAEDSTILSPHMDFTSLGILKDLAIPSVLVELGLGTDGELRPEGINEIFHEFKEQDMILHTSQISNETPEIKMFRKIFEEVKLIRAGNTAVQTLHTLDELGKQKDINLKYRFRTQIGHQKRHTWFDVHLPVEHLGKVYTIDTKKLLEMREKTSFSFANPLDQYITLKMLQPNWKTELDGYYIWSGSNRTTPLNEGMCLYCLALSYMIDIQDRKAMIDAGIELLARGDIDVLLVWHSDIKDKELSNYEIALVGDFALVSKASGKASSAAIDIGAYV